MNSEVTLVNYPTSRKPQGEVRLLFKRRDPQNAVLYEDDVPRYYLATSNNLSKVKIYDRNLHAVVDVNRRMFLSDVFVFASRNNGKAIKVVDVLKQDPTNVTRNEQFSVAMHTENGPYYWCKRGSRNWVLCEKSLASPPVAWTEVVSGTPSTWEIVVEARASSVLDYVLASLFYLKASMNCTEPGVEWENVNYYAAALTAKRYFPVQL